MLEVEVFLSEMSEVFLNEMLEVLPTARPSVLGRPVMPVIPLYAAWISDYASISSYMLALLLVSKGWIFLLPN